MHGRRRLRTKGAGRGESLEEQQDLLLKSIKDLRYPQLLYMLVRLACLKTPIPLQPLSVLKTLRSGYPHSSPLPLVMSLVYLASPFSSFVFAVHKLSMHSLGVRAYGNGCLHVGNISGFVTKFFQCSDQVHFIHISNVTSTFACDVITSNISVTFEM